MTPDIQVTLFYKSLKSYTLFLRNICNLSTFTVFPFIIRTVLNLANRSYGHYNENIQFSHTCLLPFYCEYIDCNLRAIRYRISIFLIQCNLFSVFLVYCMKLLDHSVLSVLDIDLSDNLSCDAGCQPCYLTLYNTSDLYNYHVIRPQEIIDALTNRPHLITDKSTACLAFKKQIHKNMFIHFLA